MSNKENEKLFDYVLVISLQEQKGIRCELCGSLCVRVRKLRISLSLGSFLVRFGAVSHILIFQTLCSGKYVPVISYRFPPAPEKKDKISNAALQFCFPEASSENVKEILK
jgi:hypothetical protein